MHVFLLLQTGVLLASRDTCNVPDASKVDCGVVGTHQQDCEAKGCCWHPVSTENLSGARDTPWCFHPGQGPSPSPPPPSPPTPPNPHPPPPPPGAAPFSASEMKTMRGFFLANINIAGSGGVVASPDPNTPGGSYYFHWARDGALTMNALLKTWDYNRDNVTEETGGSLDSYMQAYVKWVNNGHFSQDPNNIDSRIEPKFCLPNAPPQSDCPSGSVGKPYPGPWCRPQNDGPGLRAIALMNYADELIAKGNQDFVKANLWTGDDSSLGGGAIKYDLDWVVENWQTNTCDLWEEVQSADFFWNVFTMRKALAKGADFATAQGDSDSAKRYGAQVDVITPVVLAHYNGQFIQESSGRQKDAAVICALNDGFNDDNVFGPSFPQVAQTISTFNDVFHQMFPINSKDDSAGIPGILYGRYEGDHYAGGNPWVLTSGCLAELYYRGATEMALTHGKKTLESHAAAEWHRALYNSTKLLQPSGSLNSTQSFVGAMLSAGDGVLTRIRYHTAGGGLHQPEQLDKITGFEESAKDLTWSYATLLKAMKARDELLKAMSQVY